MIWFLAASLLSTACRRNDHLSNKVDIPANTKQQTIALQGTEKLRGQWNSGSCETLYNQASAHFRSQPLPEWLSQCEQLRERLGIWQSFALQDAMVCGRSDKLAQSVVCVLGVALFGKDRYEMETGWLLENNDSSLMFLSLWRNEKEIETIPPRRQDLVDPPSPHHNHRELMGQLIWQRSQPALHLPRSNLKEGYALHFFGVFHY